LAFLISIPIVRDIRNRNKPTSINGGSEEEYRFAAPPGYEMNENYEEDS